MSRHGGLRSMMLLLLLRVWRAFALMLSFATLMSTMCYCYCYYGYSKSEKSRKYFIINYVMKVFYYSGGKVHKRR